jgi:hypothetical protein
MLKKTALRMVSMFASKEQLSKNTMSEEQSTKVASHLLHILLHPSI